MLLIVLYSINLCDVLHLTSHNVLNVTYQKADKCDVVVTLKCEVIFDVAGRHNVIGIYTYIKRVVVIFQSLYNI